MDSAATVDNWATIRGRGPSAPYVLEARSGGSTPIGMFRASQPSGDFSDPPERGIVLTRLLKSTNGLTADFGGGRFYKERCYRNEFAIVPRNFASLTIIDGPSDIEGFYLPFEAMCAMVAPDHDAATIDDLGVLHSGQFNDHRLAVMCDNMWEEANRGGAYGDLYMDGLLLAMTARLLELRDGIALEGDGFKLSQKQLKALEDFVMHRLEEGPKIGELADLCSMSRFQFARSFKQTTGQTPSAYVLDVRLAEAKRLLAKPDDTLVDVAYTCGFSSQSHMTNIFRKHLGVTPGQYRRDAQD